MVRPLAQSFSGLLLRKNTCGTNVARLRISVWFVGNPEIGNGSGGAAECLRSKALIGELPVESGSVLQQDDQNGKPLR